MHIQVKRTGGFAGITRRAEVDTTGRADAEVWHTLAHRALAERAASHEEPSDGAPDGFRYEITVDGHTIQGTDLSLTEAQHELASRVLAERRRSG